MRAYLPASITGNADGLEDGGIRVDELAAATS